MRGRYDRMSKAHKNALHLLQNIFCYMTNNIRNPHCIKIDRVREMLANHESKINKSGGGRHIALIITKLLFINIAE